MTLFLKGACMRGHHLSISCCIPGLVGWRRLAELVADVGNLCGCEAVNSQNQNETKVSKLRAETPTERDMSLKLQTHANAWNRNTGLYSSC